MTKEEIKKELSKDLYGDKGFSFEDVWNSRQKEIDDLMKRLTMVAEIAQKEMKEKEELQSKYKKAVDGFKYIMNLIKDCQTPSNVTAVRVHCVCEETLKELGIE
jgi:meiotically up-regulated gene 157 (Mug157) protein